MFVDVLAQAANSSNTNVSMLGNSFKMVAPIAGAMKYSIQDTAIALGTMANNGVKASMGGRQLRGIIASLAKPSSDAAAAIQEKLGLSLTDSNGKMKSLMDVMKDLRQGFKGLTQEQQVQAAVTLVGRESMAGLLALVNSAPDEFDKLSNAIYNSNGAAADMQSIMDDTLYGKFKLFTSQIDGLAESFGQVLIPEIKNFLGVANSWLEKLSQMDKAQMKNIVSLGKLAIGTGIWFKVLGKGLTTASNFITNGTKMGKAFETIATAMKVSKNALMGWTLGIAAAIPAIIGLISYMSKADERLAEFNKGLVDNVNKTRDEIKETNDIIAEYEKIQSQMKLLPPDSKEYEAQKKRLIELQGRLIEVLPESSKLFDEEGNAIKDATGALREMNKEKAKAMAKEAMSFFTNGKNEIDKMPEKIKQWEGLSKEIENTNAKISELSKMNPNDIIMVDGYPKKVSELINVEKSLLNQRLEKSREIETFLGQAKDMATALTEAGEPIPKWLQQILKESEKLGKEAGENIDNYKGKFNELNHEISKSTLDDLKLDEDMNRVITAMEKSMNEGIITAKDFNNGLQTYLNTSSMDFGALNSEVDHAMQLMLLDLSKGKIGLEEFQRNTSIMSMLSSKEFRNLSDESRKFISDLLVNFANGDIKADEFGSQLIKTLTGSKVAFEGLSNISSEKMNELIGTFLDGGMSAQALELAFKMLAQNANADISYLTDGTIGKLNELYNSFKNGKTSSEELRTAIGEAMGMSSDEIANFIANANPKLNDLIGMFANCKISAEDFELGMSNLNFMSSEAFKGLGKEARTQLNEVQTAFLNGEISAQQFQANILSAMGLSQGHIEQFVNGSNANLINLISQFFNGEISAQQLRDAIKDIPETANTEVDNTAPEAQEKVENYKDSLDGVPPSENTDLNNNAPESQGKVENYKNSLNTVPESENTNLNNDAPQSEGKVSSYIKKLYDTPKSTDTSLKNNASDATKSVSNYTNSINSVPKEKRTNFVIDIVKNVKNFVSNIFGGDEKNRMIRPPLDITPAPAHINKVTLRATDMVQFSDNTVTPNIDVKAPQVKAPIITEGKSTETTKYSRSGDDKDYDEAKRKEEELQREREQMERDANANIERERDRLYRALKNKIEEQKKIELKAYDDRIAKIREEMGLLQDDTKEKERNLEKLKQDLALWEKQAASGDGYAKVQAEKIKQQVAELEKELKLKELQNQIDEIEKEKDKVEESYEVKLSDEWLYNEANKMILHGNLEEMTKLVETYAPDFGDIGLLFGQSLADGIKNGLKEGLEGLKYLQDNGYKPNSKSGRTLMLPPSENNLDKTTILSSLKSFNLDTPLQLSVDEVLNRSKNSNINSFAANNLVPTMESMGQKYQNVGGDINNTTNNNVVKIENINIKSDTNNPQKMGTDIRKEIYDGFRRQGFNGVLSR